MLGLSTDVGAASVPVRDHSLGAFAPGQLLVGMAPGVGTEMARRLAARGLRIEVNLQFDDIVAVRTPVGRELEMIPVLEQTPGVLWVEPNYILQAQAEPNDPRWPEQWWQQTLKSALAWDIAYGSSETIVAVIDTGVDLDHPDLPTLWRNPGEIAGNGLDDDGNGKIDDVNGWHWSMDLHGDSHEDNDIQIPTEGDNPPNPKAFHGMHVAGIIAAQVDNGVGVAGVARGPLLMPLRVLDKNAVGAISQVAEAIHYAVDNDARVINLSLGTSQPSHTLEAAITYAHEHDVVVVAAAGNDGGALLYPAAIPEVIAVGGVTAEDERATFSNRGEQLDITAPAVDILSTWASSYRGGYHALSGTSMAAAQVSGAAALLLALDPSSTPEIIAERLAVSALDLGEPGWDESFGWGRLRLNQALEMASSQFELTLLADQSFVQPGRPLHLSLEIRNAAGDLAGDGLPIRVVVGDLEHGLYLTSHGRADVEITAPADLAVGEKLQVNAVWRARTAGVTLPVHALPTYLPLIAPP